MCASNPNNWTAPNWHPDWGNPEAELEMLKHFCLPLLEHCPDYSVELQIPEPGLMYVDIFLKTTKVGELYIVAGLKDQPTQRYGLFVFLEDEEEYYFDEVDEGLGYLTGNADGPAG